MNTKNNEKTFITNLNFPVFYAAKCSCLTGLFTSVNELFFTTENSN